MRLPVELGLDKLGIRELPEGKVREYLRTLIDKLEAMHRLLYSDMLRADVDLESGTTDKNILYWNDSDKKWKADTPPGSDTDICTLTTDQTITGKKTFDNDVDVTGDLTVDGDIYATSGTVQTKRILAGGI